MEEKKTEGDIGVNVSIDVGVRSYSFGRTLTVIAILH